MEVFIINVKNMRDDKPLQPSTTNAFLRRFLAHLKAKYNVCMSLNKDFNFPGGLTGVFVLYSYFSNSVSSRA